MSKQAHEKRGVRPQVLAVSLAMVALSLFVIWFSGRPENKVAVSISQKHASGQLAAKAIAPARPSGKKTSRRPPLDGVLSGEAKGQLMPSIQEKSIQSAEEARTWVSAGTPEALTELHKIIKELPDGEAKEGVGRLAAKLRGAEFAQVLLDALLTETDAEVQRSVKLALIKGATRETVGEMVRRYGSIANAVDKERIAAVLRSMQSPDAVGAMVELVGLQEYPATELLTSAVLEGLSKMGTPPAVMTVLQRLDGAQPGEDITHLWKLVTSMDTPEAHKYLENVAQGKKGIESSTTRAAAIYALRHYPGVQTTALLNQLSRDANQTVSDASKWTLVWFSSQKDSPPTSTNIHGI